MQVEKVLILSGEEVKDILVRHFTNAVVRDVKRVEDCIRTGTPLFPNLNGKTSSELACLAIGIQEVGEFGVNAGADRVMMLRHDDYYHCLWNKETDSASP